MFLIFYFIYNYMFYNDFENSTIYKKSKHFKDVVMIWIPCTERERGLSIKVWIMIIMIISINDLNNVLWCDCGALQLTLPY